MAIFGDCPVCPTKDQHILFLQGQVESLTKRLTEILSPGANARVAYTPPPPREKAEGVRTHSPARLAQSRARRPEDSNPETDRLAGVVASIQARDIEAEFTKGQG